jgi:hypothetical protein
MVSKFPLIVLSVDLVNDCNKVQTPFLNTWLQIVASIDQTNDDVYTFLRISDIST